MEPIVRQTLLESSTFKYFLLFGKAGILQSKRKHQSNNKNGEPQAKRFKHSESSSSSSEDDDDSMDSESTFDLFSSDSESNSDASSFAEYSNSENDENASDSDNSPSQDDISIKDEPLYDSDLDLHSDGDDSNVNHNRSRESFQSDVPVTTSTIKTEVLDSIVDAVEVERNSLLNNGDIRVKEEPIDAADSTQPSSAVEIKEEPDSEEPVGSTSGPPPQTFG
ncbi:unnamed protein product [Hermetia illucens]|uniref:Uncharacterized protein n=1 Tax=Hermetia illucens TaxID=343691 RepID=A0A7R8UTL4_HERIL|nr:suppressor protein SRP40-like isoform X1 [Hermetia illucens]CAD7086844.1 unnamed protein product [Hermetia illucens]